MKLLPLAVLVLSVACSRPAPSLKSGTADQPRDSTVPEVPLPTLDTPVATDTAIGACVVALQSPSEHDRAIIEALRHAYGLERELYQRVDSITTWDQVYEHYRRGFGEQLAQQFADYSWEAPTGRLRATHMATVVPDSVGVIELKQSEALVAWISPSDFRLQWELPRCILDRLERQDEHWVIVQRDQQ